MADRFFIAPYDSESGLQTNVKPWLIPDQAFSQLDNVYVFRGRVRKRFGSRFTGDVGATQLNSRLRVQVGTIGAPLSPVPGGIGAIGQMFSAETQTFYVWQANGAMLAAGPGTGNFNIATGVFALAATGLAAGTPIFWYPALPVMGLLTYENGQLNSEPTIAFDTRYAYQFNTVTVGWDRIAAGVSVWQGSDTNFFWATTWTSTNAFQPVFFVTNFDQNDPNFMRWWDGAIWTIFRPQIDATPNYLNNCRILVNFRNRLLAFNTWEGPDIAGQQNYVNRCRYSQVGSPLDANSFRQDIPGRGSAIDAPTTEAIVTVEFIKDRLVVFFERSTFELCYTGNQAYPFVWNKLNTELGAESTNSIVPFDKITIGIGSTGFHACNGQNVERIDDNIPDSVFEIHNGDNGVQRVYGIRDYDVEMVYWTFPDTDADSTFPYPNRIFVYNYKTGTWAINDDSFTAFGYFIQPFDVSPSWDSTTVTWDSSETWDSGTLQSQHRDIVAGNQEGYVVIIDTNLPVNSPALQISNITYLGLTVTFTVINHNLRDGDYVLIQNLTSSGNLATTLNNTIYYVNGDLTLPNTFTIDVRDPSGTLVLTGTYTGGGTLARVSQINIKTKEYNFYEKEGRNCYVSRVDFMVDKTALGEIQVDYFVSTAVDPLLQDSGPTGTNALVGNGNLETSAYATVPFEQNATRVIHPIYLQADGEFIQLQLILSDEQMTRVVVSGDNVSISGPALEDFQLHFMVIHAQKTAYRFQ